MFILYVVAGIIGIAVITVIALVLAARKHGPAIAVAQRELFTETGFRHPELPNGSIDDQVKFVPRRGNALKMELETRYEKALQDGDKVRFEATVKTEGRQRVRRQSWTRTLSSPPAVKLQIADRSLSSLGKAVKEAVTGSKRSWEAVYPIPVAIGDAAMDERFLVYGDSEDTARRALQSPELRSLLLGLAEVDLVVLDREIRFSDPRDRNMSSEKGGAMTSGLDPSPSIRASIPVHRRVLDTIEAVHAAVTK